MGFENQEKTRTNCPKISDRNTKSFPLETTFSMQKEKNDNKNSLKGKAFFSDKDHKRHKMCLKHKQTFLYKSPLLRRRGQYAKGQ